MSESGDRHHNHAQFLSEALDSAVAQTLEGVEVVVVDDGRPTTQAVLARYGGRLRVIRQPNRVWPPRAAWGSPP